MKLKITSFIIISFGLIIATAYNGLDRLLLPCKPFQTNFMGKEIAFPMKLTDAAKKYDLTLQNNERGIPKSEKDTLMIVATENKSAYIYGMAFYLRGLSIPQKMALIDSLEKKFGQKFYTHSDNKGYSYMKITPCVYMSVHFDEFSASEIFKGYSDKKVSCIVGLYYDIPERFLFFLTEERPGIHFSSGDHIPF